MLSDFDKEFFGEIVAGKGSWYTAHLIRLVAKADPINRALLKKVYPDVVAYFEEWEKEEL